MNDKDMFFIALGICERDWIFNDYFILTVHVLPAFLVLSMTAKQYLRVLDDADVLNPQGSR